LTLHKILIFTDWYVPAYKAGGPVTSIKNLVKLLRKDFDFFVVCGDRDLGDTKPYADLGINEWQKGINGEQILYLAPNNCTKKIYNNIIEVIKPNTIYYNSLFSKNFTLKPILYYSNTGIKSFLSPRGMLHPAAFKIKKIKKLFFINVVKRLPLFKKVIFLATDETEKKHILRHGFKNSIKILPNIPDLDLIEIPLKSKTIFNKAITVSRIAPEKNSLLALEAIGKIKNPISYTWIGDSKDKVYFDVFMKKAKTLPSNITFNYLGALPKALITENLFKNDIFFLPTLGENFGHAIYEALALGLPCVISNKTPFQSIEKSLAGFICEPNDMEGFITSLNKLFKLQDEASINLYQTNARNIAQDSFDAENAALQYKEVW